LEVGINGHNFGRGPSKNHLKIEISSNGQNCSISSQKVPKFELYKHNDEPFNSSNLGTFWLKIEQFWPFEEISIFSNGGHLGYRTALTDTNLTPSCIQDGRHY
jgi:hypothetical protein